MAGSFTFSSGSGQGNRESFDGHFAFQLSVFPFLQIADHAKPGGMCCLLEIQDIIVWLDRFKTKHFDQCSRLFSKMEARLNDFCIIEYHQTALQQIFRQRSENIFTDFSTTVY